MTRGNFKNINNHDNIFLHTCIHKMLLLCCKTENDLPVTNSEVPVNIAQSILGYTPPITLSHAVWQYEQCMKTTTGGQYTI